MSHFTHGIWGNWIERRLEMEEAQITIDEESAKATKELRKEQEREKKQAKKQRKKDKKERKRMHPEGKCSDDEEEEGG
eukprot:gene39063-38818_t